MSGTTRDYYQQTWDEQVEADLLRLMRMAIEEDSPHGRDLTSLALIPGESTGQATVTARESGIVAGLAGVIPLIHLYDQRLQWESRFQDGDAIHASDPIGVLSGPVIAMLGVERLVLNLMGRLSAIASLTARYVEKIQGTAAHIYDTRKTIPGWRRLDKYAVHCGGGRNHRMGLYDHILIKDNHLAFGGSIDFTPAQAVRKARNYLNDLANREHSEPALVEIEVDNLTQFASVLPENPDIVLLDNMKPAMLAEAVMLRNQFGSTAQLEASGGVVFDTVRDIALSGVERVSVGALTHSAGNFDFGLDWN